MASRQELGANYDALHGGAVTDDLNGEVDEDMPEIPGMPADGYLEDFISGLPVRDTPEEREAVQVMARRLVEDFHYPKDHVQTRPQFRVRKSPSDKAKSYPVDIAVFDSHEHREDNARILIECKRKSRRDGIMQLRLYMDMSPSAEIGIWFNGEDHEYLRKVFRPDGTRVYEVLPNIPRFGQEVDDVGKYTRKDLVKPSNLKAVFRDLRNHLAGNVTGITRDEALAQEIVNILFCKIFDELNTRQNDNVTFRAGPGEDAEAIEKRILQLFKEVKAEYNEVFTESDSITLDRQSIAYVVGELQTYCVTEADRDAIGDAFEVFIGPALRGAEGQFFTPRNVVRMVIEMLDPEPGEMIIDPACGSGGFLIAALEHVWSKLERQAEEMGWSDVQLDRKKRDVATKTFRGLDKDSFLAKVTKAYMAIVGDGKGGVFCSNSLQAPTEWEYAAQMKIGLGSFDVVMTNPPFGKKIKITGAPLLGQYDLGHRWKRDTSSGAMELTTTLQADQPPQLLFLERCLQLLKPDGRLGIVLPESILGNPSYQHVLRWLEERTTIEAVVTLPEALFKTSGKGGTHAKVCVLLLRKTPGTSKIFMADAKWCGHDSRGNRTVRIDEKGVARLMDDVPIVAERFKLHQAGKLRTTDHLGYVLDKKDVQNQILVPKYYDPDLKKNIATLRKTHDLVTLGELVAADAVSIGTGIEVGKMAYGTGPVPFIRTSDISNWELKSDAKQGVSESLYMSLRGKCDVEQDDILLVRDGTYLIGTCAVVTKYDLPMLFQSHIFRIRVLDRLKIDPWLLFASLNAPIVKRQIRSKQFTQDIIDTLGSRLLELQLPIPRDESDRARIAETTQRTVTVRSQLRSQADLIAREVEAVGGD
jgi:type I restriction enzyme M protein